jgi:dUTP pyrophosphatase
MDSQRKSYFATFMAAMEKYTVPLAQLLPGQNYALLKLYVDPSNNHLLDTYKKHIAAHNEKLRDAQFPDSGFDVFVPEETVFQKPFETQMVDLKIRGEMVLYQSSNSIVIPSPYYVYPRSSMSKTPLMLANHTGIIDSGYRGNLMAAVRWIPALPLQKVDSPPNYVIQKETRLFQICHPSLCPVFVELVEDVAELTTTERGAGGFGSTGVVGGL